MPQHAELCWLLNTVTPMGWMEKMIQYKEKAKKQVKKVGKPLMKREYAPPVEKIKQKVIKRSPQEEAYFTYLGLELNEK